jgi:hypothetical protein
MTKKDQNRGELLAIQPSTVTVLPPQAGVLGEFLTDTENMFRARAMRMKALFRRINETGQRMEGLLRMAAERMDSAEARLQEDLRGQGLLGEVEMKDGEWVDLLHGS